CTEIPSRGKASSFDLGSQNGFTLLSPEMLDRTQLSIDGSIHFLLMVVIIGQATVNLSQREVRVLALDLIGIPVVCQTIQGDLKNFRLRPNQPNFTIGAFLDVGVVSRSRHSFQLPWRTRTSPMDIILRTQRRGMARIVKAPVCRHRSDTESGDTILNSVVFPSGRVPAQRLPRLPVENYVWCPRNPPPSLTISDLSRFPPLSDHFALLSDQGDRDALESRPHRVSCKHFVDPSTMSPHAYLARSPVGLADKGLDGATHSPLPRIGWGHPLSATKDWMGPPTLRYQGNVDGPFRHRLGSILAIYPVNPSSLLEQSLQLVGQPIASDGNPASCDSLSVGLVANRTIEEPGDVRVQVLVDRAEADLDILLGPIPDVLLGQLLGEGGGREFLRNLTGQLIDGGRARVRAEQVVPVSVQGPLSTAHGSWIRKAHTVPAAISLGQSLGKSGHRVQRLVNVSGLMHDPAQVKGFRLDRRAWVLDLLEMGHVRVQDVLARHRRLDFVLLIRQDSEIYVVGLGSAELVPGFAPGFVREDRCVPEKV